MATKRAQGGTASARSRSPPGTAQGLQYSAANLRRAADRYEKLADRLEEAINTASPPLEYGTPNPKPQGNRSPGISSEHLSEESYYSTNEEPTPAAEVFTSQQGSKAPGESFLDTILYEREALARREQELLHEKEALDRERKLLLQLSPLKESRQDGKAPPPKSAVTPAKSIDPNVIASPSWQKQQATPSDSPAYREVVEYWRTRRPVPVTAPVDAVDDDEADAATEAEWQRLQEARRDLERNKQEFQEEVQLFQQQTDELARLRAEFEADKQNSWSELAESARDFEKRMELLEKESEWQEIRNRRESLELSQERAALRLEASRTEQERDRAIQSLEAQRRELSSDRAKLQQQAEAARAEWERTKKELEKLQGRDSSVETTGHATTKKSPKRSDSGTSVVVTVEVTGQ
eukprot:TRINITY_DN10065_c0_g1_i1.p1 TRINITY_DN10065_c0_g1~~TRINITY_DN10065_c0_g1_i1.p1  ORF type:complete len:415 (+),score=93.62 TRINITY_DN10065_c0_g1_i1:22-1245(+)